MIYYTPEAHMARLNGCDHPFYYTLLVKRLHGVNYSQICRFWRGLTETALYYTGVRRKQKQYSRPTNNRTKLPSIHFKRVVKQFFKSQHKVA